MSMMRMAVLEVLRRKVSFVLAMMAVAVAVGAMLCTSAALKVYDLRAEKLLSEKEAELNKRLKTLEDEMRKATLKLSFNLVILPAADPKAMLGAIAEHRITMILAIPTLLRMLLDHPDAAGADLSSLRAVVYAAAPAAPALVRRSSNLRCARCAM